ncbi:DUF308 domain-containing protein [Pilimelia columellifera]|uniref:DUF308 domain-containing protein n=1 Tax=Pilimelia columellifera subsp. columellifera TaxID=706583 RepID=A0ABP6AKE1_9ACTN
MSAGEAEQGRRDNGLAAGGYADAGDVELGVGERLLPVLAADGIAAYLQAKAPGPAVPAQATARLYVDLTRIDAARSHLDRLSPDTAVPPASARKPTVDPTSGAAPDPTQVNATDATSVGDGGAGSVADPTADPGPGSGAGPAATATDVDTEFARIVAGYHLSGAAPHDVDPGPAQLPQIDAGIRVRPGGFDDDPSLLDGLDTFGDGIADDDDRYVPPPPPPLPRLSKFTVAALAAVASGLLLFLMPHLIPGITADIGTLVAVALLLTGVGTLLARMRPDRSEDPYDPDDGAVV